MEKLTANDIAVTEEALKWWERHHQNIADELLRQNPEERAKRETKVRRAKEARRKLMAAND